MDVLIPDSWLRDFLKTKAKVSEIAKYLSLCGPSVEKQEKHEDEIVYSIEVTTNRVDSASVYGIAREAAAILPRFKIKASLLPIKLPNPNFSEKVSYLDAQVDPKLCPRFSAVLIKNVAIKPSPSWMIKRLKAIGIRSINNVVDISNYIMHELGQPVHTFDYDKIAGSKMILRESRKGEKITTLDGKSHTLTGGDIVIEDGSKKLIDLAGIMGGVNSAVDEKTKNVLLFVQTYNPARIRSTSMSLAHRTDAASLFEKDLDPELVKIGILRGIELFAAHTGGKAEKNILDIYPQPCRPKPIKTTLDFIEKRIGIKITKKEISKILDSLEIKNHWQNDDLEVIMPSYRAKDINISEDVIEEIVRIYGYHNLPGKIMEGEIPERLVDSPFGFENKLKNLLRGWGGSEIYTLSLVSEKETEDKALRLKNPLGAESEFLRTSMFPSLLRAAEENSGLAEGFHLFEVANVYLPKSGSLPEEKQMLAGIFCLTDFREAKGIIEALLEELNLEAQMDVEEANHFAAGRCLATSSNNRKLGIFGMLEKKDHLYYEFDVEKLRRCTQAYTPFKPFPKYPPQVEDITLVLPDKTRVGDVYRLISSFDKLITKTELIDIYKKAYTFRVWYQHPDKTLTDNEVESIRISLLNKVRDRFGATIKD